MENLFALTIIATLAIKVGTACTSTNSTTNKFGEKIDSKVAPVTFSPEIATKIQYVKGNASTTMNWGLFEGDGLKNQASNVNRERSVKYILA